MSHLLLQWHAGQSWPCQHTGYLAQGASLAAAGNEQRDMRLLKRTGRTGCIGELEVSPLVGKWLLTPQTSHNLDSFLQHLLAFARPQPGNVQCGKFLRVVTDADSQHQPAPTDAVNVSSDSSQYGWAAEVDAAGGRAITADILLMYGGKSDSSWVNLAIERLAAVLPRSETCEFPTLDHFGIDQKAPQAVATAVSAFFLKE